MGKPRGDDFHKGMDKKSLQRSILNHLRYTLAKGEQDATPHDRYLSIAYAVRDRLIERWIQTQQEYYRKDVKRVYYLSMEYLPGRALGNAIMNLRLDDEFSRALDEIAWKLEDFRDLEPDPGLGNGGLGRLAACMLDSMATLQLPAVGYGLRYEFGIFRQSIQEGNQVEEPDPWLRRGHPWELERPENAYRVKFYGKVEVDSAEEGSGRGRWVDTEEVLAVPFDTPIPGYGNNTVNNMRLWSAKATSDFDLEYFHHADYVRAVEKQALSENITKVLYPPDRKPAGRELRLKQQYFLVSASLQDILRRYRTNNDTLENLPKKVSIQLNETHPSLAIPELMRILVDDEGIEWDRAWEMTQAIFGYTNHTLLPEAWETWAVERMEKLLPRHFQIILEINSRFLRQIADRHPGDSDRLHRMSLVQEGEEKRIRMANLAMIGSHSVNGVSELHTKLLKERVANDFHEFFPGRFNNKTNGITPRRWLLKCNPDLSGLITDRIGDAWKTDLFLLEKIRDFAEDAEFGVAWRAAKKANKERLSIYSRRTTGIDIDPESMLDCLVKRFHEYKRQHLKLLHVIDLYLRIQDDPGAEIFPRTVLFGGKAAPDYTMAKRIIRLINDVAKVVNADERMKGRLNVLFLPDYRVSLAERIIPAADLSEQISTAGREASGTGNMKFALNGALTIGTLDGANIEICNAVGKENMFLFGLTSDEVTDAREGYDPRTLVEGNPRLKRILDLIGGGFFRPDEPGCYTPLLDSILGNDEYMVLKDFDSYMDAQELAERIYRDPDTWTRMSIRNVAAMGRFSSDRTVSEYAKEIWGVSATPIRIP